MNEVLKKVEAVVEKIEKVGEEKAIIKASMDELKSKVVELEAEIQKMRRHSKDSVLEQFPGFVEENEAKNFLEFAKAVFTKDSVTIKAMTEGTDSAGGYLVPDEIVPTLARVIENYGIIRRNATVLPMSRQNLNIASLASGVTVYWPGEGSAITESQPTLGNVGLVAKKLAALIPVSGELMEDSSLAMANLLATLVGESMAAEEDRVGFAGQVAGGDPFDGILYKTGVTSVVMGSGDTAFSNVDADDLSDLIAAVTSGAAAGAKFYMHRTIFNLVRKLKDSQGSYIYVPPAGTQPGTLWGYPYELVEQMPALSASGASKPFIAFGNLRNLYLGDRKRMSMDTSIHFKFNMDLTYLRFIERIAIDVAVPSAFSILVTAAS